MKTNRTNRPVEPKYLHKRQIQFTRPYGMHLCRLAAMQDNDKLIAELRDLAEFGGLAYRRAAQRFIDWIDGKRDKLPSRLFVRGNSKLGKVIMAWSVAPFVTCPGMGVCAKYCYSLKSWRNAEAFFRQLSNLYILKNHRHLIAEAFAKLPACDLRLYVDGDFDSAETMGFWFDLLRTRPDVDAYGYSKSWHLFLNYKREFPSNYTLNLSNGSRLDTVAGYRERMEKLSCTRGTFAAISGVKSKAKDTPKLEHARDVRARAAELGLGRVFVCPGKCGECLKNGKHACGNKAFTGVTIAIAIS